MDRRVKWTNPALDDLAEIAEYISRDSRQYATAMVAELRRAARSLAKFSYRSRKVPEIGRTDVRELMISSFRLIFQIKTDHIRILAVLHEARDLSLWYESMN